MRATFCPKCFEYSLTEGVPDPAGVATETCLVCRTTAVETSGRSKGADARPDGPKAVGDVLDAGKGTAKGITYEV